MIRDFVREVACVIDGSLWKTNPRLQNILGKRLYLVCMSLDLDMNSPKLCMYSISRCSMLFYSTLHVVLQKCGTLQNNTLRI